MTPGDDLQTDEVLRKQRVGVGARALASQNGDVAARTQDAPAVVERIVDIDVGDEMRGSFLE